MSQYLSLVLFLTALMGCVQDTTVGTKLFSSNESGILPSEPEEQDPLSPEQRARFTVFQEVLTSRCTICHNARGSIANDNVDDFTQFKTEQDWASGFSPYVIPGNPEGSLLYDSLRVAGEGTNDPSKMPAVGEPLTNEQRNAVRDWILNIDTDTFKPDPTQQRCGDPDPVGAPQRLATVINILDNHRCTNCHGGNIGNNSPTLFGVATDSQFVNNDIIIPGDYKRSLLYGSLKGATDSNGGAMNMPQGAGAMSANELQAIRDWICQNPAQKP